MTREEWERLLFVAFMVDAVLVAIIVVGVIAVLVSRLVS